MPSQATMTSDEGSEPSPLPPKVLDFQKMVAACGKWPPSPQQQKFVKKKDCIPTVALPVEETCRSALNLVDRGLIGQFTGLWPSPKSVEDWIKRNGSWLIKEGIKSYFVGKAFFVFVFESVEDWSLIFRNGPYFMGSQGLYLNKWSPDFDPTQDVPTAVPVWVRLPHLPLHCWNQKSLQIIGNSLGKYIDQATKKYKYSCAQICVEVDMEEGLPEAIKLTVARWSHIQELNYEQIPFKFQKNGHAKAARKGPNKGNNSKEHGNEKRNPQALDENPNPKGSSSPNPPEVDLITPAQIEDPQANKDGGGAASPGASQGSPSIPSYADITKKKVAKPFDSSKGEIYEKPSKRASRKPHKVVREEEAEHLKMQGSQCTIEMTIGRNSRARPSKGGIPNPSPGK
eukprot:PITA_28376